MRAIEVLVEELIDYAGLYPPASLDMQTAVRNYLNYGQSRYGYALGRFVVDLSHIGKLREAAGHSMNLMSLSVVASPASDWEKLSEMAASGLRIEMVEIKPGQAREVASLNKRVPEGAKAYFELPMDGEGSDFVEMIAGAGTRAKLRMGGITPDAFPSASGAARTLKELACRGITFKATAGLHHPIRSRHPFTYEIDSQSGVMHGFLNLFCAAALIHFKGDVNDAESLLEDQDTTAWDVSDTAIRWRSFCLSTMQVREVRRKFMNSFGCCSFEEPIQGLEALGWL